MHALQISSLRGQKSTCISQKDFPNDEKWTRCNYKYNIQMRSGTRCSR